MLHVINCHSNSGLTKDICPLLDPVYAVYHYEKCNFRHLCCSATSKVLFMYGIKCTPITPGQESSFNQKAKRKIPAKLILYILP